MNLIFPEIEPCESCGYALPVECDGSGIIVCQICMADTGHILCYVCAEFDYDDDGGDSGERMAA